MHLRFELRAHWLSIGLGVNLMIVFLAGFVAIDHLPKHVWISAFLAIIKIATIPILFILQGWAIIVSISVAWHDKLKTFVRKSW